MRWHHHVHRAGNIHLVLGDGLFGENGAHHGKQKGSSRQTGTASSSHRFLLLGFVSTKWQPLDSALTNWLWNDIQSSPCLVRTRISGFSRTLIRVQNSGTAVLSCFRNARRSVCFPY